eukprot:scaffold4501_cov108-Isochrysis_galbana.AAC.11
MDRHQRRVADRHLGLDRLRGKDSRESGQGGGGTRLMGLATSSATKRRNDWARSPTRSPCVSSAATSLLSRSRRRHADTVLERRSSAGPATASTDVPRPDSRVTCATSHASAGGSGGKRKAVSRRVYRAPTRLGSKRPEKTAVDNNTTQPVRAYTL